MGQHGMAREFLGRDGPDLVRRRVETQHLVGVCPITWLSLGITTACSARYGVVREREDFPMRSRFFSGRQGNWTGSGPQPGGLAALGCGIRGSRADSTAFSHEFPSRVIRFPCRPSLLARTAPQRRVSQPASAPAYPEPAPWRPRVVAGRRSTADTTSARSRAGRRHCPTGRGRVRPCPARGP